MTAAGEIMMLSRLLIMPGAEHAVQIFVIDLCMFVLKKRGSMVLQGSYIMNGTTSGALRGPRSGLVVASTAKASLLGSQFKSKQCR